MFWTPRCPSRTGWDPGTGPLAAARRPKGDRRTGSFVYFPLSSLPLAAQDSTEEGPSGGPLLSLVARGLELWLRQQCQAVEALEIRLEGSMAQLLRGHLQGVHLRARKVVFQNLSLERVDLRSDPLQLRIGGLLRGQSLRLEHPFLVRGAVVLTGDGLSRSLATPEWQELADQLSTTFLGVTPLRGVRFLGERLLLQAQPQRGGEIVQVETHLGLTPTGLVVAPLDGRPPLPLEMDGAIRLERAEVRGGLLELAGEATVQP